MASKLTETIFTLYQHQPRVALLISGAGSNANNLLSDQELRDYYEIASIASDNPQSNAKELAGRHGIPAIIQPATSLANPGERQNYFSSMAAALGKMGVEAIFYAGFMKIVTPAFCEQFPGVNVHPADLTIYGEDGLPKYRGMNALGDMRNDLGYVKATVHTIDVPVDAGDAILVSRSLASTPDLTDEQLHSRLKTEEHIIYPLALKMIARGEISFSDIPVQLSSLALGENG